MKLEYREIECACGCGERFTQARVGRVRKYKDDTHKSRANNKRTWEAVAIARSLKGAVLLRHICDNMETEDIALWYPDLSVDQWAVIDAIRNTTIPYDNFMAALSEMAKW